MTSSIISVKGLRKSYGARTVLDGVDLEVKTGEVFALLGANGSGKTTLVEILEGYRDRDAGDVMVAGFDPASGAGQMYADIGVVPQETIIENFLTVGETLAMYTQMYDGPGSGDTTSLDPAALASRVGLGDRLDTRINTLSGGQQRRVDLAVGLIGSPKLLFLDEPTTGFDPVARRDAWDLIGSMQADGMTIVLTTHYLEEARTLADRIGFLRDGRIEAVGDLQSLSDEFQASTSIQFKIAPAHTSSTERPTIPTPPGASKDGEWWKVRTDDPTGVLHALTGWAIDEGLRLDDLQASTSVLEDLYFTNDSQTSSSSPQGEAPS